MSTWLNGGVPPTTAAEWAGHSVEVLLRIYAKGLDGGDEAAPTGGCYTATAITAYTGHQRRRCTPIQPSFRLHDQNPQAAPCRTLRL